MKTPHVPDVTDSPKAPLAVGCDAVLGSTVDDGESWAILADGKIMDICPSAEESINQLAKRIGNGAAATRRFMEQNGWLLVRIQTTHKIVAVLKTLNAKVLPNAPHEPHAKNL